MESETKYQIANGTYYHFDTSETVINVLETARANRTRITVDYGDVKTGVSWEETHNVTGRVGRSTGSIKIPLLIHNSRSMGGCGILTHCIIGIKESKGGKVLYSVGKGIQSKE